MGSAVLDPSWEMVVDHLGSDPACGRAAAASGVITELVTYKAPGRDFPLPGAGSGPGGAGTPAPRVGTPAPRDGNSRPKGGR